MKDTKRIILNALFFILLILATYYIIFKDFDMRDILNNIKNLDPKYLLLSLLFMCLYLILEGANINLILKSFKEKLSFFKAIIYSFVCFFFSAITPGGSGGQPITIFYLRQEKIKVSHSALAYLVQLFGYNVSSLLLGIISAILHPEIFQNQLLLLFIVGSIFLLIPISLTVIGIFSYPLLKKLVDLLIKIISIFKPKNLESIKEKTYEELQVFHDGSDYIKTHKLEFSKSFILSFIQVITIYTIPYFIFRSFGLDGYSVIFFIQLQAILHNATASIPLPGAVGITETVYLLIFSFVYPYNLLHSSLIVSRIFTFYIFVLISLIIFLLARALKKRQNI